MELATHNLWWHGPAWLSHAVINLPITILPETSIDTKNTTLAHISIPADCSLIEQYSNIRKLKRITAHCRRFFYNLKNTQNERKFGPLTAFEIEESLMAPIKTVQQQELTSELSCCMDKKTYQNQANYYVLIHLWIVLAF